MPSVCSNKNKLQWKLLGWIYHAAGAKLFLYVLTRQEYEFDNSTYIYDDATQWSGSVARGFNDALSIGLTSICHSKVGHLFPEEAYSDKGQGRDKDRPITGWKIGWDRVNIWAWKSVCLCIWVSNFPFVLKSWNTLIWHQFLSRF